MATHNNQSLIKQFFEECWNHGAVGRLNDLLAPDHVHHLPGWDLHGPQQVGELIADLRIAFSDLHFIIDDVIVGQDKIVIRWIAHGTHLGDFFGLPPTGNRVEYTGIDIIRCSNGRIVELWGQPDSAGLNRQLRAI
jgi:predicted ester cyclase